ncbi:MAG: DUF5050 domain-containing protein [Oscillospiraceae bacterium]|nr:DUF5050 domain-containing protein [Oscillospiraceae bacterium]
MAKKITAIILTFAILFTLTACGDNKSESGASTGGGRSNTQSNNSNQPADSQTNGNQEQEEVKNTEKRGNIIENSNRNNGFLASDGEWIYILYSGKIHKIKEDGSEHQIIINLDGFHFQELNFYDGYFYFTEGSLQSDEQMTVQKIKADGTEQQTLASSDSMRGLCVVDDFVYYYASEAIYKMNLDGSGNTALIKETADSFAVINGFVYYVNLAEDEAGQCLNKVSVNGGNPQALTDGFTSDFVADENNIYYYMSIFNEMSKWGVWSITHNGTNNEKILERDVFSSVYKGKLFKSDQIDLKQITDNILIAKNFIIEHSFYNGKIYYMHDGDVRRKDLDGSNEEIFIEG